MLKKRILQDHLKRGNTFYPPFLAKGEEFGFTEVNWRKDLMPELIWIALLVNRYNFENARTLARALACPTTEQAEQTGLLRVGIVSGFAALSARKKYDIRIKLQREGVLVDIRAALDPLLRLYPRCPLRFLLGKEPPSVRKQEALEILEPVVWECLFRGETLPTLAQGVYFDVLAASGKMFFDKSIRIPDTAALSAYPDSEESQRTAAFVRCIVNNEGLFGGPRDWPAYFWRQGVKLGACKALPDDGIELGSLKQEFLYYQVECFRRYCEDAMALWCQIESNLEYDLYSPIRNEVLLGLASRIYRIAVQIVSFPPNWTEDMGQIFVRLAAESYIYWKWLRERGEDGHFKKFYEHGLGQQKLFKEHIESYLREQGLDEDEIEKTNPGLRFLQRHKMSEFVPVNVGNPLDSNIRVLAEQADLRELYALVYGPTSSMIHGMYDSLERYYLKRCVNPFHGLHHVPHYEYKSPVSIYGIANCLQIMDLVFEEYLRGLSLKVPEALPGDRYMERLFDHNELRQFLERPEVKERVESSNQFLRRTSEGLEKRR